MLFEFEKGNLQLGHCTELFWILLEGKGKFGEEVPCNLKPKAGF
jgi:hypothetical protein